MEGQIITRTMALPYNCHCFTALPTWCGRGQKYRYILLNWWTLVWDHEFLYAPTKWRKIFFLIHLTSSFPKVCLWCFFIKSYYESFYVSFLYVSFSLQRIRLIHILFSKRMTSHIQELRSYHLEQLNSYIATSQLPKIY